mgnify:CR=1 FL=1
MIERFTGLPLPPLPTKVEVKIRRNLSLLMDDAIGGIIGGDDGSLGHCGHAQTEIDFLRVDDKMLADMISENYGYSVCTASLENCPLNETGLNKEDDGRYRYFKRDKPLQLVTRDGHDGLGFIYDGHYFPCVNAVMAYMVVDGIRKGRDCLTSNPADILTINLDDQLSGHIAGITKHIKDYVVV